MTWAGTGRARWIASSWIPAMLVEVAGALRFAHDHNVLHRDISPDNILVRRDDSTVLTDFGLALPLEHERISSIGATVGVLTHFRLVRLTGLVFRCCCSGCSHGQRHDQ